MAGLRRPRVGLTAVATIGLLATFVLATTRERTNQQRAEAEFERLTDKIVDRVSERTRLFEVGLRGGRGAFLVDPELGHDEWRAYVQSFDVDREFWGALGFGYVARVARADGTDYVTRMRTTVPEFSIHVPDDAHGEHDDLFVIQYIEPQEQNRAVFGLDIGAEPCRRAAAEQAMRTGLPTLTSPLKLRQLDGRRIGMLYLIPVYGRGAPVATEADRIAALRGWVYAPIVAERAMRGLADLTDNLVDFDVFDGEDASRSVLLYDDDRHLPPGVCGIEERNYEDRRFATRRSVQVGGRPWTIVVSSRRTFEALYAGISVVWTWSLGLALTAATVACFWVLANGRRRAMDLAGEMTSQLAVRNAQLEAARAGAETATEAKSQFLAHMSHELRTPLTAILGFSQVLAEPDIGSSERIDHALTIQRNGEHMLTLINEVLDSSKIAAGKMTVESIEMSILDVVADVQKLLQHRAKEKGLRLHAAFASKIPNRLICDPTRVRQVLTNLVGNAVKFTTRGEVRIEVDCNLPSAGGEAGRLLVRVVDTGKGMTGEQVGRLFQAFMQGDVATARDHGGTGLGLSISKHLAELLGGDLRAQSEPGRGTTFTLDLPLQLAAGAAWIDATDARAAAGPATRVKAASLAGRVLLVDDGPDNRRLIGLVLERAGASVETAENGHQAVDLVLATRGAGAGYDLILMDMQMPGLDGPSATRTLRRAGVTTPIVALTANLLATDLEACRTAGCDDVVGKPIQQAHFLATCRTFVERSRRESDEQDAS
jgi:signal transduction histidine kinase/AmiR/NasT family two-component response regulator